jgi:hypothetical protein
MAKGMHNKEGRLRKDKGRKGQREERKEQGIRV